MQIISYFLLFIVGKSLGSQKITALHFEKKKRFFFFYFLLCFLPPSYYII